MRRTTKLLYSYICILTMNIMGNRVMLGFSINDATVDDICVIREPHSFHLGLSAFYHVKATSLRWGGGASLASLNCGWFFLSACGDLIIFPDEKVKANLSGESMLKKENPETCQVQSAMQLWLTLLCA